MLPSTHKARGKRQLQDVWVQIQSWRFPPTSHLAAQQLQLLSYVILSLQADACRAKCTQSRHESAFNAPLFFLLELRLAGLLFTTVEALKSATQSLSLNCMAWEEKFW